MTSTYCTDPSTKVEPGVISVTRRIDDNQNILRDRIYNEKGIVIKDIDFYHTNGKGHFFPHVHWFENGKYRSKYNER